MNNISIFFILYFILIFANFSTNFILFNNLTKIDTEFVKIRFKIHKLEEEMEKLKINKSEVKKINEK